MKLVKSESEIETQGRELALILQEEVRRFVREHSAPLGAPVFALRLTRNWFAAPFALSELGQQQLEDLERQADDDGGAP